MLKSVLPILLVVSAAVPSVGQEYERYRTLIPNESVFSKHLNGYRNITVTVPLEFDPSSEARFPLIIVFDRQNGRSHGFIHSSIDYLTSNEQMPASVIIGVESVMDMRYEETQLRISDPKGRGEENGRFIVEELLPYIRKRYMAGGHVTLIGHSRYGYFTTHLLMRHPDVFSAVVALSPFVRQQGVNLADSVGALVQRLPGHRHTYYRMAVGNDFPDDFHLMQTALAKVPKDARLDSDGILLPRADHNAVPGIYMTTALYGIYEEWNRIQDVYMADTTGSVALLDSLRGAIGRHYGEDIALSLGVLNGKGWQYFNDGRYAEAVTAWEAMTASYPPFLEGHLYIAEAKRRLRQDVRPSLKRFMAGIITSQFYDEGEKAALLKELQDFEAKMEEEGW